MLLNAKVRRLVMIVVSARPAQILEQVEGQHAVSLFVLDGLHEVSIPCIEMPT